MSCQCHAPCRHSSSPAVVHVDISQPRSLSSAKSQATHPHDLPVPHPYNLDRKKGVVDRLRTVASAVVSEPRGQAESTRPSHSYRRRCTSSHHRGHRGSRLKNDSESTRPKQWYQNDSHCKTTCIISTAAEAPTSVKEQQTCSFPRPTADELSRARHRDVHTPQLSQQQGGDSNGASLSPFDLYRSRPALKHLFRELEAAAAQTLFAVPNTSPNPVRTPTLTGEVGCESTRGNTSRRGGYRSTKELYQSLFLQALEDSAAWERRAHSLAAAVEAHEKRERTLIQQLQRTRQALALLAAYVEGAERVAGAVEGRGGRRNENAHINAGLVFPPHGPTSKSSVIPASSTATQSSDNASNGARQTSVAKEERDGNGMSPLQRRLPARSSVSDLVHGLLGRSLDLTNSSASRSISAEDGGAGDDTNGVTLSREVRAYVFKSIPYPEQPAAEHGECADDKGFTDESIISSVSGEVDRCLSKNAVEEMHQLIDEARNDGCTVSVSSVHRSRIGQMESTTSVLLQRPPGGQQREQERCQHSASQPRIPADASFTSSLPTLSFQAGGVTKSIGRIPSLSVTAAKVEDDTATPLAPASVSVSLKGVKTTSVGASPFIPPTSADSSAQSMLSAEETGLVVAIETRTQKEALLPSSDSQHATSSPPASSATSNASPASDLLKLMRGRVAASVAQPPLVENHSMTTDEPDSIKTPPIGSRKVTELGAVKTASKGRAPRPFQLVTSAHQPLSRSAFSSCSSSSVHAVLQPPSVDYEVTVNHGQASHPASADTNPETKIAAASSPSRSKQSTPALLATPTASAIEFNGFEQEEDINASSAPIAAAELLRHLVLHASSPSLHRQVNPMQSFLKGNADVHTDSFHNNTTHVGGGESEMNSGCVKRCERCSLNGAHSFDLTTSSSSGDWESVGSSSSTKVH